jgi:tight adherence protein C
MDVLIALLAALTVVLLIVAVFTPNRSAKVERRLDHLQDETPLDPYEMSFMQRVVAPAVLRVTRVITGLLPQHVIEGIDARLEHAGRPMALSRYLALWTMLGVAFPVLLLLVFTVSGDESGGQTMLLAVGGLTLFGLIGPPIWLRGKVKRRRLAIDRSLPDAIDLIVTNVEAGLGLQAALLAVAEKMEGPIAVEFGRSVREVSLGRSREEALLEMAERTGVQDVYLFAHAISQAERTGISIGRVLRAYARESRERRRQRARELAGRIPIKVTVPTVLFIFPTLFLIVLAPPALRTWEQFGGF